MLKFISRLLNALFGGIPNKLDDVKAKSASESQEFHIPKILNPYAKENRLKESEIRLTSIFPNKKVEARYYELMEEAERDLNPTLKP